MTTNDAVQEKSISTTSSRSHIELVDKVKRSCTRPHLLTIAGITAVVLVTLFIGGTIGWFVKPKSMEMRFKPVTKTVTKTVTNENEPIKEKEKMRMVSDACVDDMYDMMTHVANGMERHNLEYWIMYGTLIGARRNTPGGPLRWDDDLDIAMWEKNEVQLKSTLFKDETFLSQVKVTEVLFGYQLRLKKTRAKCKDDNLDIFLFRYENRNLYGKQWYEKSGWFNSQYIKDESEVHPLLNCTLWNINTFCPRQTDVILKRAFSENVLTHAKMWSHTQSVDEIVDLQERVNDGYTMPQMTKRIAEFMGFSKSQSVFEKSQ